MTNENWEMGFVADGGGDDGDEKVDDRHAWEEEADDVKDQDDNQDTDESEDGWEEADKDWGDSDWV